MSTVYGKSRTNYFCVKDEAEFQDWAENFDLQVFESKVEPGKFMLLPSEDSDDGLFCLYDDDDGDELDLADELAKHVAPGSIAIVIGVGAEKLDIGGWAQAVDHTGKKVEIHLNDIYALAKSEFGVDVLGWGYGR